LIESTRHGSENIDQIVANPHLFDLVRARIAADSSIATNSSRFATRHAYVLAAASIVIVFIVGIAIIPRRESQNFSPADVVVQVPEAIPVTARPDHPPKPMFSKLPSGRVFSSRTKAPNLNIKRSEPRSKTPPAQPLPLGEFYALSYGDDLEEKTSGGRIIRVDMPRSSLFAMGMNIPLENGSEVVKTDLLIGSDGVARAVRIVE
jgi:hypothetical protein